MVRIDAVTEDFLTDKGKGQGGKSGNYRSDANRELNRFVEFLVQHEDAVTTFEELESGHLREYAQYLTRQGWATGTVRTYYAYVSAFCGWAVREGHLDESVAQRRNATNPSLMTAATRAVTSKPSQPMTVDNLLNSSTSRHAKLSTTSVRIERRRSKPVATALSFISSRTPEFGERRFFGVEAMSAAKDSAEKTFTSRTAT